MMAPNLSDRRDLRGALSPLVVRAAAPPSGLGRVAAFALACAVAGCSNEPSQSSPAPTATVAASEPSVARPEIVTPPPGTRDGKAFLRSELERARKDGRTLLVDVGAPWCEPCKLFHAALSAGELDGEFPNLRFVEFNVEKHRSLVNGIGCKSRLVPLFARVNDDGTCSADRREGGVKGARAVSFLVGRVRELLTSKPSP